MNKKKKRKETKRKQTLINPDKQTDRLADRETDGQIDTNHSLKWDTILNNTVNQIQSNQIESNWIESN